MEKETNRQKKVGTLIQHDLAEIIQQELRKVGKTSVIVSVSKVRVTSDFSLAKAYLSVFPNDKAESVMEDLQKHRLQLKNQIAQRAKHQLRKMPDLLLYLDDSLEYINSIEQAIKGKENPIEKPDLLDKRKKL